MGARVAAANHLGEVLTESEPREAPAQAAYQSLIDEMSRFHAELFHAIARSPLWPRIMVVVTYDEHGGFYDHVEPADPAWVRVSRQRTTSARS